MTERTSCPHVLGLYSVQCKQCYKPSVNTGGCLFGQNLKDGQRHAIRSLHEHCLQRKSVDRGQLEINMHPYASSAYSSREEECSSAHTFTPSHFRGTLSMTAAIAATAFSTHCCSPCDVRPTLMVKLLPPAAKVHAYMCERDAHAHLHACESGSERGADNRRQAHT